MNDFTMGGLVGVIVALVVAGVVAYFLRRRDQATHQRTIDALQAQVVDLRQERTEDKEINRQLRRDLAGRRPGTVEKSSASARPPEPALAAAPEQPAALVDRVATLEAELSERTAELSERTAELSERTAELSEREAELDQCHARIAQFDARMAERDDKLRQYRESLAEIRQALEAQNHPARFGE